MNETPKLPDPPQTRTSCAYWRRTAPSPTSAP